MIDANWIKQNIKDKSVLKFLKDHAYTELEHEDVPELIADIVGSENDAMNDNEYYWDDYYDLDEVIKTFKLISRTLKVLENYV